MRASSHTPLYDQPRKMTQQQLELAWLASLYERPEDCRKVGLMGLDHSRFSNESLFEIGVAILRDVNFTGRNPDDSLIEKMIRGSWFSKIEKACDSMIHLPSLYKIYCQEIELRASVKEVEAPWMN
jgi:hypothetical protein